MLQPGTIYVHEHLRDWALFAAGAAVGHSSWLLVPPSTLSAQQHQFST